MKRRAGFGALVGSIVIACSGGGGSGGGGGGGSATDSSSFVAAYCDAIAGTCCPKHGKTYNKTSCVAFLSLAEGQGGAYNASIGSTCLSQIQAAVQTPTFCDDYGASNTTVSAACKGVYGSGGTKQPGDVCTQDSDCATSTQGDVSCVTHFTSADGGSAQTETCQLQLHAKQGDACAGDQNGDETSFSADSDGPTIGICFATDNLYCDDTTKVCTPLAAIGAACAAFASESCVPGARCDETTQKCVALTPIGGACQSVGTVDDPCDTTGYCNGTTCVAALAVGAPCTTSEACGQKATCTNGACSTDGDLTSTFLCGN